MGNTNSNEQVVSNYCDLLYALGTRVAIIQFEHVLCPMTGPHVIDDYNERAQYAYTGRISQRNKVGSKLVQSMLVAGIQPVIVTSASSGHNGHVLPDGGFVFQGDQLIRSWLIATEGEEVANAAKIWEYDDKKFVPTIKTVLEYYNMPIANSLSLTAA